MTGKNNAPGVPCNGNSHRAFHIDHADVVAPGASTVVNNHTVIIRFSFTIRISGESLERMFRVLKEKFGTARDPFRWRKFLRGDDLCARGNPVGNGLGLTLHPGGNGR